MTKMSPYACELTRLSTFKDLKLEPSVGKPCPSALARCGFYYNIDTQSIKCWSCQMCMLESQLDADFENVHKTNSPTCGAVLQTKPLDAAAPASANVPLADPIAILEKYKNDLDVADDQADAFVHGARSGMRRAYKLLKAVCTRSQSSRALDVKLLETEVKIDRANPDFEKLRSEELRLSTYNGWSTRANISPIQLARNGFYYTGSSDRVQCVFCRGYLRNWEVGDTPDGEHRKHYPECPFVCGLDVGNKPITDAQLSTALKRLNLNQTDQQSSRPASEPASVPAAKPPVGRPKHPEFQQVAVRVKSFEGKMIPNGQDVNMLAAAGYYHVGPQDNVKCFFCDGGLKNWQPNDDPWMEHAKWFPRCGYLMSARDPDYIRAVQDTYRPQLAMQGNLPLNIVNTPLALPAATNSAPASGRFTVEPREIKARMDSPTVEAVLKMGYARETVRQAILMKLSTTGDDFPNAESLVEAVIALQERNEQQPLAIGSGSGSAAAADVGMSASQTANKSSATVPSSTTNDARALSSNQAASAPVKSAATAAPVTKAPGDHIDDLAASASAATNKNAKSNKKKKKKKKAAGGPAEVTASNSAAGDDDVEKDEDREMERDEKELLASALGESADDPEARSLVEENRQLKEAKLCKICMDADVNIVFLPCGHLACCSNCAPAIRNCAICRAYIRGTVRIFLA